MVWPSQVPPRSASSPRRREIPGGGVHEGRRDPGARRRRNRGSSTSHADRCEEVEVQPPAHAGFGIAFEVEFALQGAGQDVGRPTGIEELGAGAGGKGNAAAKAATSALPSPKSMLMTSEPRSVEYSSIQERPLAMCRRWCQVIWWRGSSWSSHSGTGTRRVERGGRGGDMAMPMAICRMRLGHRPASESRCRAVGFDLVGIDEGIRDTRAVPLGHQPTTLDDQQCAGETEGRTGGSSANAVSTSLVSLRGRHVHSAPGRPFVGGPGHLIGLLGQRRQRDIDDGRGLRSALVRP